MPFKDCVAVLSGAGRLRGIGASTAIQLAKEGANILINCVKSKDQAELVLEKCRGYGVDAELYMGDASQQEICKGMATFAKERWGRADFLVNCMGMTKPMPYSQFDKLTKDDFDEQFSVNVVGPFLMIQAFEPLLKESIDSAIVNISSQAGQTGIGSSLVYATTKGALDTFSKGAAKALAPTRVNVISPGMVDSAWWDEKVSGDESKYKKLMESMRQGNILGHVISPKDVAETVVATLRNRAMTGQVITLNAGSHLGKFVPEEPPKAESTEKSAPTSSFSNAR